MQVQGDSCFVILWADFRAKRYLLTLNLVLKTVIQYLAALVVSPFLFFHPLQSCLQAQFLRAEKHVQELNMSVDLMKKESMKLLERSALAEKDMKRGLSELMYASTSAELISLI